MLQQAYKVGIVIMHFFLQVRELRIRQISSSMWGSWELADKTQTWAVWLYIWSLSTTLYYLQGEKREKGHAA